ncbi:unnamed protein product [Angiostrongylus costaricensis]|uniref:WD_REPEATS_REGION domain-containing protein n=1 Tax=Angiostrongylus costaricensis TaxID=334426 RepID=A0A158PF79_ANGCS|nr:unnamed protein product [Angiostrongylus costaricensis]
MNFFNIYGNFSDHRFVLTICRCVHLMVIPHLFAGLSLFQMRIRSFRLLRTELSSLLWSIKPEFDTVEAQCTYNRHQRSILEVALLSNTQIASTDGTVHVWDPFHGAVITQMDWDGDTTICGLQHIDRHLMAAISSLHSTVRLMDTRIGGWSCELKVSNLPGLTRAFCVRESGEWTVVALSNGSLVVLDARTGRLASLSHGNSTHATAVRWLSAEEFLVCDADEVGNVFAVTPRISSIRRLADIVASAFVSDDKLVCLLVTSLVAKLPQLPVWAVCIED